MPFLQAVLSGFDEVEILKKIVLLGRMRDAVVNRLAIDYGNGVVGTWISVRFKLCVLGCVCSLLLVDVLVESGEFDAGVDAKVIVDVARKNLVRVDGTLRFGIDEVEPGCIAIRIFPSRQLALASSLSSGSVGQQVEAYIVKACRRSNLDAAALVPCVVLSLGCSAFCVVLGSNFGPLMSRCS